MISGKGKDGVIVKDIPSIFMFRRRNGSLRGLIDDSPKVLFTCQEKFAYIFSILMP